MKPLPLVAGVALAIFLAVRRRRLGRAELGGGILVVAGCVLVGLGVVAVPDFVGIIERVGRTLGPYTYLLVGALAFMETGAFIGLIAPGETAVLVGGVVAGQGEISPVLLIAIVWSCAVAGDLTSYTLGRRLGRSFLLRHGGRLKITEARLSQVEGFFERRGGITILVGRFIGLVRALAPFIAGASRMEMRRFLPYDVLGAGLWSALFVMLGYVFWQSLDTVTKYVGRGLLVFSLLVGIVLAIIYARRLRRDPELRETVRAWLQERPALRPLLRLAGPADALYERLAVGAFGLEVITLLALAAVGGFGFFALADALGPGRGFLPGDAEALTIGRTLAVGRVQDVVGVLTDIGSLAFVGAVTLLTAGWAIRRRRIIDAAAVVAGLALTFAAVHIAKAAEARPRPAGPLVDTSGLSFPSGHAAYSLGLVACAIVLVRAGSSLALRFAAVSVALGAMVFVGLSRIYLRAHYLSDVLGGLGLAAAVYSLCGVVALIVARVRHNPSP